MSQNLSAVILAAISLFVIFCGSVNGYGEYGDSTTYTTDDRLCSSGARCSPINSCPLIRDLMLRACFSTERLRDFTCGYQGTEPLVCCPRSGEFSPVLLSKPNYFRSPSGERYPVENFEPSRTNVDAAYTSRPWTSMDIPSSSSVKDLNVNCGQAIVRDTKYSSLGAQPWVVRVGFLNVNTRKTSHVCLGSIISANVILTSAYCASASDDVNFLSSVRVGEFDTKTNPDCNEEFCANPVRAYAIERAIIHSEYDAKTYVHNVALLILNETIQYNLAAQPICLLTNSEVHLIGRRGFVLGWGKSTNNNGQEVSPSQQQQIELPIIPLEECRKVYEQKVPISNEYLCVGGERTKDACSGFSGAPFVLLDHHTYSRYYQVAIMSFGTDKCGKDGTASVYTKSYNYIEWIRLNMKN